MSKPSITNCPNTFFRKVHSFNCMYSLNGAESCNSTFNNQHSTLLIRLLVCKYVITHYQVVIAVRSHLFPFRTEKLSSLAPMVLQCGRVGSRLLLSRASDFERFLRLFCFHAESSFSHADCFLGHADFFFVAFPFFQQISQMCTDFRPVRSGMTQIL